MSLASRSQRRSSLVLTQRWQNLLVSDPPTGSFPQRILIESSVFFEKIGCCRRASMDEDWCSFLEPNDGTTYGYSFPIAFVGIVIAWNKILVSASSFLGNNGFTVRYQSWSGAFRWVYSEISIK
jgi:hypothetical protein